MGIRSFFGLDLQPPAVDPESVPAAFSIDAGTVEEAAGVSVPPESVGLSSYAPPVAPAPRVNRRMAMQVPGYRRANKLVGTLGTLPLNVVNSDYTIQPNSWLQQPEKDVPRAVTMTRLVEDLANDGIAWWKVTAFDWRGYPARGGIVRLDPTTVDVLPDWRVRVTLGGHRGQSYEYPQDGELIRFEVAGNGWLVDGARAIRQHLILDAAAQRYAEGAPPGDYFTDADGFDPMDEDEITETLNKWRAMRQLRSTGYVPASLKYNPNAINPEQLELADQRNHAVLEIARLTGIDPEELGVSTTSRTYSNQFDRRKQFIDFTLGEFRSVIEDRLSMGDVTPAGQRVQFDLDAFLRSDAKSRYEATEIGLRVGAIDPAEVRPSEGKPQIGTPPAADPTAPPAPTEEVVTA